MKLWGRFNSFVREFEGKHTIRFDNDDFKMAIITLLMLTQASPVAAPPTLVRWTFFFASLAA